MSDLSQPMTNLLITNKTEKLWFLLCSPVFIPQIAGGVADPPGFVTEKISVAHWLASVAASPACILKRTH